MEQDRTFLQGLINGSANLLDETLLDKLEPMFATYAEDPEMMGLLNSAAQAYSEAATKAAMAALA